MFPSQPLMKAIFTDRERQLERSSREHRMLDAETIEPVATARLLTTSTVGRIGRKSGAGRPGDPACGVA